jgi:hypothetical protein
LAAESGVISYNRKFSHKMIKNHNKSQNWPKTRLLYFKLHAMITTRLVVLGEEGIVNPNRCFAAMQKLLTTDEMLLGEAGLDRCRGQVVRVGHKL